MSHFIPATYMIPAYTRVIFRGASPAQLWMNGIILFAMGVVLLLVAARKFSKMTV